jgi:hemerythrin-like domain-containing protein
VESLVKTLKAQHQAVQRMVAELEGKLQRQDAEAATAVLGRLKEALLAHLELEDRELYPGLVRHAQAQHMLQVAKTFSSNMEFISQGLKDFLSRHERITDIATFRMEWQGVREVLRQRIHSEETSLYPLYERVSATTAAAPAAEAAQAG